MNVLRIFTVTVRCQSINSNIRILRPTSVFFQSKRFCEQQKCDQEESYDEVMAAMIGNREMVGPGFNGMPVYADRPDFPFPSIRYKELTPDIMALREKERGDWRLLTIAEKKEIYRSSYCQTYAEFQFVTSEWMAVVGWALIAISAGLWMYMFINYFVYNPRPRSFNAAHQEAYWKRVLDLKVNPITGIASKYDYEKMEWKVQPWFFKMPNPNRDECGNLLDSGDDDDDSDL